MNKEELVSKIAADASITKAVAGKALKSFIDSVSQTLSNGENLTLVGFGTFSIVQRAARKGRNPRTGAEIKIAANKAPKFKPGKALKEAIQKVGQKARSAKASGAKGQAKKR
ncbi:MAG: HU family DNA-binding protein [Candidatus Tectomicrobia bacterium]|uniref:HU family DNA-binding protein n=1 Tax=Tectimicrobiota bacterium TaxID=2528274 RepID=A0A933LPH3_UNCTE|nr:HU family DNA-binding protein [Candidatus Tectomicrobia bacterium]